MNLYNLNKQQEKIVTAQAKPLSEDERQFGYEDTMGAVQRYSHDPYAVKVYKTLLGKEKIAVCITLNSLWAGGVIWQDFWAYKTSEGSTAEDTFQRIVKVANEIFNDFRVNEIPNLFLYTHLREACRWLDMEHKPKSRVPYVDWAREQNGVIDWRSSIYGTRYPKQNGY
jgi:hypothetical protein